MPRDTITFTHGHLIFEFQVNQIPDGYTFGKLTDKCGADPRESSLMFRPYVATQDFIGKTLTDLDPVFTVYSVAEPDFEENSDGMMVVNAQRSALEEFSERQRTDIRTELKRRHRALANDSYAYSALWPFKRFNRELKTANKTFNEIGDAIAFLAVGRCLNNRMGDPTMTSAGNAPSYNLAAGSLAGFFSPSKVGPPPPYEEPPPYVNPPPY